MSGTPAVVPDDGPQVEAHPLVVRARALADTLLAPAAAAVDAGTVPRSHLDALGVAGLLGLAAPPGAGGTATPPAVVRRVSEVLAGADLSTWFVQAQHHGPVRAVAEAGGRADLAAGRVVAGIAFSHLRRWPARPVMAARVDGGWRLDGTAPWYTGWGLSDIALVAGATPDARAVFALVEPRPGPHLHAGEPMAVAAVAAALTVALTFDGLVVPDRDVVSVRVLAEWARADRGVAVNAVPAVFGLTESAVRLLDAAGRDRDEPAAVEAARRLGERLVAVRGEAYRLLDDVPPDEAVAQRLGLRAAAGRLAVEATTALVVAGAGAAMATASPAQRKAREALFLLVQAQTREARTAALRLWGR